MHLLAQGGMLPIYSAPADEQTISPRRKGVKQGVLLMLLGAVLVPLLGVMAGFAPGRLDNVFAFFAAMTAVVCFVGGPLRMLFAAIFEEGAKPYPFPPATNYAPPPIPPARVSALPPATAMPTASVRPRTQTAEIAAPPSVTDSTTRLLDKEPKAE